MADRETIAATLTAGILSAADFSGARAEPAEYAVTLYQKVLAAIAKAEADARRPSGILKPAPDRTAG